MSIILKGIDMPEHCYECLLRQGNCCLLLYEAVPPTVPLKRLADCPLVDIPTPHGRLIDGDKLCYEFIDWQYTEAPDHLNTKEGRMVTDHERQYEIYLALGEAVIEIANAPTILEAEE